MRRREEEVRVVGSLGGSVSPVPCMVKNENKVDPKNLIVLFYLSEYKNILKSKHASTVQQTDTSCKAFKRLQTGSLNNGGTMCEPEIHVLDMGFE